MDNQKIANLLFPNAKPVSFWEEKYKPRDIKGNVSRIAPSPTGFLHIGTVYGAMIDWQIARNNGVFYFRLEDTDKKREINNAGTIAYDSLCHYNLKPDEGYTGDNKSDVGNYGPYTQSNRMDIYQSYAKKLVEEGKAFPCFCEKRNDKEEILEERQKDIEESSTINDKDPCRNLSDTEIEQNIASGKPFAIRLLSCGDENKTFIYEDLIKGKREIRENTKDVVLLKSDGIPPYAFAHAVDDHLMGTTIVVRGEEWFPSVSAHFEIFKALGFSPIKYAHTPVICKLDEDGNKRKLSKRKDPEADARYFVKEGYPVESVLEYLLTLLNSNFEIWRTQNPMLPYTEFPFSISKIGSNNPMFDLIKLSDISKNYISKLSAEKFYDSVLIWAKEFDTTFANTLENNKEYALKVFNIDRETPKPRKDIAKWSEVKQYYNYMFSNEYEKDFGDKFNKNLIIEVLNTYSKVYDEKQDKQTWFNTIKSICSQLGFCDDMKVYKLEPEKYLGSVADLSTIIRVAITGRVNSPDLFEIMQVLGKNQVLERLKIKL